jgi:hypothetical protein
MPNPRIESDQKKEDPIKTALMLILIGTILIVAFPFMIPQIVRDISLRLKFREASLKQGRFLILIYSNSTIWQTYIENNILPKVQDHAIILNWSDRSRWDKSSWTVRAFEHWGGRRNFNPMAIVFRSLISVRVIRFYRPFLDHKHGRSAPLRQAESQLIEAVESRAKAQGPQFAA